MKIELRIDWSELDAFGHINNLEIMKYVQTARVNFLSQTGLMQMQSIEKKGPILASIHTQFFKPLFFPGNVGVISTLDYVKTSSFKVHHQIFNDENELVAEAYEIIVFYDFEHKHKLTIPEDLRKKIEETI